MGFVLSSPITISVSGLRLRSPITVVSDLRLRLWSSSSSFVFGYQLQIGLEFRILILERGLRFGRGATITGPPDPVPPTYPPEVLNIDLLPTDLFATAISSCFQ